MVVHGVFRGGAYTRSDPPPPHLNPTVALSRPAIRTGMLKHTQR